METLFRQNLPMQISGNNLLIASGATQPAGGAGDAAARASFRAALAGGGVAGGTAAAKPQTAQPPKDISETKKPQAFTPASFEADITSAATAQKPAAPAPIAGNAVATPYAPILPPGSQLNIVI
ncbi:MAG TPA: hypothetical protein VFI93_12185 [Rhizomicrobium sp.]|nr:hypothetical protein [Rhizomicrobium sp.]